MKILRGKNKKKVLAKLMTSKKDDFNRGWLEGLQYIKDLPSVHSDA